MLTLRSNKPTSPEQEERAEPQPRGRRVPAGSVSITPTEFDLAHDRELSADDIALLLLACHAIADRRPLAPRQTFEGTGLDATLIIPSGYGLVGAPLDPDARMAGWRHGLANLERLGYLESEQHGNLVRIRLLKPAKRLIAPRRSSR